MPSQSRDSYSYTPAKIPGVPHYQWRALLGDGGRWYIQARLLPDGAWVDQSREAMEIEIRHGTEIGGWLRGWR